MCHHCGNILLDGRTRKRIRKEVAFTLSLGELKIPAVTADYSDDGARIMYKGNPIPVGTVMDLNIDKLNIHGAAEAVWAKRVSRSQTQAGLRLL